MSDRGVFLGVRFYYYVLCRYLRMAHEAKAAILKPGTPWYSVTCSLWLPSLLAVTWAALLTIAIPGNEDSEGTGFVFAPIPQGLYMTTLWRRSLACAGWEYLSPEVMLQVNEENFHCSPALIDTFRYWSQSCVWGSFKRCLCQWVHLDHG